MQDQVVNEIVEKVTAGLKVNVEGLRMELKADIAELKVDIAGLKSGTAELKADTAELRADLNILRTEVKSGFEATNKRFDSIDKRFDSIDKRFEYTDNNILRLHKIVEEEYVNLTSMIDETNGKLDRTNSELGTFRRVTNRQFHELREQLIRIDDTLAEHADKIFRS